MGCNEHLHIEKRQPDGTWRSVDPPKTPITLEDVPAHIENKNTYLEQNPYDIWSLGSAWNDQGWIDRDYNKVPEGTPGARLYYRSIPWDLGRNYDIYAILADVRNGYGFAGCDTGDGFRPISKPKGLPDDVSEEVKYEALEVWGGDGHSYSWLTLKELQDYDWDQTTKCRGTVDEEEYKRYLSEKGGQGEPSQYSGGISGWMIREVSRPEMDDLIAGKLEREIIDPKKVEFLLPGARSTLTATPAKYVTRVEWGITYRESAKRLLEVLMPEMEKLSDGDPTSVRMVFWFDN